MSKTSAKDRIRARRRRESRRRTITALVVVAAAVGGIAFLVSRAQQFAPAPTPEGTAESLGVAQPTMESIRHVQEGSDPGPFNSDPPTSGPHYSSPLPAGFYEEDALETYGPFPEGYLVHSLEHGYVILWYNCEATLDRPCDELKGQIQDVISSSASFKVIGFPRPQSGVSVVITSWGRALEMEQFDPDLALRFVQTYRGVAPEPQGQ